MTFRLKDYYHSPTYHPLGILIVCPLVCTIHYTMYYVVLTLVGYLVSIYLSCSKCCK